MKFFKFATYTLGCKVSQYESEALAEKLVDLGGVEVSFNQVADAYVINTCTVTAESDAKSRKYIRRALRKNPEAIVAVMGCYSQRAPEEVASIDGVSIVCGTADKMKLAPMIAKLLSEKEPAPIVMTKPLDDEGFEPMCVTKPGRTRAYVKIEDGCECRCTYCAIADARGPVRSKPVSEVIAEVEALAKNGTREVVLTGIETGSYGADFEEKYDLGDLIYELDKRGSCERIRLGSLAPELIGERFIAKVRDTKILAPHFHLSMQSGSDDVLRRMKRRYNTDMALRNMGIIREAFPNATFTTDLMVGFPGERDGDFENTLEFVKKARFLDCHVFAYSRRAGTPAATYENQVPEEIKRKRSEILIAEKNKVRDDVLEEICLRGELLPCVFETRDGNAWTAHSDTFAEVRVEFDQDIAGKLLMVKPDLARDGVIYGKIVFS